MTTAFSFAFNYVTRYEQQSIGLQWDNFAQSPVEDDAFNCLYCCLFLIFDSILYSLLGVVILICKYCIKFLSVSPVANLTFSLFFQLHPKIVLLMLELLRK